MKESCINCLGVLVVIILTISFIVFLVFTIGSWMNPNSPPRQAAERMEEYFQRDKESFAIVRDYLIDMRHEYSVGSISMRRGVGERSFDGTVFLGLEHGHIPIKNEVVLNAIHQLFAYGYSSITMRYNYVTFQRWSTLDNGWGALYLLEGDELVSTPHGAIILAGLSVDGWYFYRTG